MEYRQYFLKIAGRNFQCEFLNDGTEKCFGDYCKVEGGRKLPSISISRELFEKKKKIYNEQFDDVTLEFNMITDEISNELLKDRCCLFHGLAFVWRNKSYIFTAPSGTGKTTQYVLWKKCYGDEIQIVNGDKPILEICDNGSVMVHPSPWNGKERMGSNLKAQLGGIVLLQQGRENTIRRLSRKEAVLPLLKQFFFTAEKEETIHQICKFEEYLLENIPVWELVNCGDEASAKMTYKTLEEYEEENK